MSTKVTAFVSETVNPIVVMATLLKLGLSINFLAAEYSKTNKTFSVIHQDFKIEDSDFIINIGGDGTVLRSTHYRYDNKISLSIPTLNINGGTLGFLSDSDFFQMEDSINLLISGKYTTDERTMLQIDIGDYSNIALNDCNILRFPESTLPTYNIIKNGTEFASYFADGIIVATPTGSTAYSYSAGGPIVDPQMECMIVTPICCHNAYARASVLSLNSTLNITVNSRQSEDVFCSIDGIGKKVMTCDEILRISQFPDNVKFARVNKPVSFIDVIRNKLS